ncbi:MAG: hypothetical protein P4L50_23110 [Anaerolineaceae bacterium]|nr:hypothetical protein [Anaerolineaceae bacterium]
MSGRRIFTFLLAFILIILSACNAQESTPVRPAPSLAVHLPTSQPATATVRASVTSPLPTGTPTLTPTATSTPNPNAGKAVMIKTIKMVDTQNGWAVGQIGSSSDSILFTRDGAASWKNVSPPQASGPVVSTNSAAAAFFLNASQAWVIFHDQDPQSGVSPEVVWRTSDGGHTWNISQDIALDSSVQMDFFSPSQIGFSDPQNGWLLVHLGAGMSHDYVAIFTSQDGGATWQAVVDPNQDNLNMGCDKSGVTFLNSAVAWAAGNCQGVAPILYFYRSGDAGHSWEMAEVPSPTGKTNLFQSDAEACGATPPVFLSEKDGSFLVQCLDAQNNQASQWLYITRDRGQSWSSQPLPAPFSVGVDFIDPTRGWMVGSSSNDDVKGSKVYFTQDGGQSWTPLATVDWAGAPDFVDAQTGWAITLSNNSTGSPTSLVKSTNGGKSWKELNPKIAP